MTALAGELTGQRPPGATAATVGVFDGVHRGHHHLVAQLQSVASQNRLASVVITFRNHPLSVLRPDIPLTLLTTLEERLELLYDLGVRHVVAVSFTRDLSLLTPEQFCRELVAHLHLQHLVVGPDVALGHKRAGSASVLQELGRQQGFDVTIATPLKIDGEAVSSSRIRASLAKGNILGATTLLGRPVTLRGTVRRGEGRGASLGFPTANLAVAPEGALPADGIYAAWVEKDRQRLPSAVSIGTKPTFHPHGRREVEAHILDFVGDLYGHEIRLEFVGRIRGQHRFESTTDLIQQMHQDIAATRALLASAC